MDLSLDEISAIQRTIYMGLLFYHNTAKAQKMLRFWFYSARLSKMFSVVLFGGKSFVRWAKKNLLHRNTLPTAA